MCDGERCGKGFVRRQGCRGWDEELSDERKQKTVFSGDDDEPLAGIEWDDRDFERWEEKLIFRDERVSEWLKSIN